MIVHISHLLCSISQVRAEGLKEHEIKGQITVKYILPEGHLSAVIP